MNNKFLAFAVTGATVVATPLMAFSGRRPSESDTLDKTARVPASTEAAPSPPPVSPTTRVEVDSVSLVVDLASHKKKVTGLTEEGILNFEKRDPSAAAVKGTVPPGFKCAIPVSIELQSGGPELNASVTRGLQGISPKLGKAGSTGGTKDFSTGLFAKHPTGVAKLTEGRTEDLFGEYEMVALPELGKFGPGPRVAPMNKQGIGFVLPVTRDFRNPAKILIRQKVDIESQKNTLCQQIQSNGFTVKAAGRG